MEEARAPSIAATRKPWRARPRSMAAGSQSSVPASLQNLRAAG